MVLMGTLIMIVMATLALAIPAGIFYLIYKLIKKETKVFTTDAEKEIIKIYNKANEENKERIIKLMKEIREINNGEGL
ncbi:hypothetical protein FACS1894188_01160 [Clostridia bacterium]|nr:hypothetical protein FACS1894188_01160 [Clostridia bacterium]